jgi:hypothetical protein
VIVHILAENAFPNFNSFETTSTLATRMGFSNAVDKEFL